MWSNQYCMFPSWKMKNIKIKNLFLKFLMDLTCVYITHLINGNIFMPMCLDITTVDGLGRNSG